MRRILMCVVTLVALGLAPPARAGVAVGVRGGLSLSGIAGDADFIATSTKQGAGGGLFFTFGLSDLLSVQPEALYVAKGSSWGVFREDAGDPGSWQVLSVADYLEIPVLLKLSLPVKSRARPVLAAGPAVAFKVRERLKYAGAGSYSRASEFFKGTDLGVAAGLGLERPGGGGRWSLDARYTHGLSRVDREPLVVTRDSHNWNVLVTIGFARAID